jgi:hypothetical protein
MQNTRLSEIDALKRNLSSVLATIERECRARGGFLADLDGLIEARNLRLHQIAIIGHLIETAFMSALGSQMPDEQSSCDG